MAAEESIFFKPTPWQTDIQAESLSKASVSVGIVVEARGEALQGETVCCLSGLTAPGSFLYSLVPPCSGGVTTQESTVGSSTDLLA